jgi:hypothetical protein
MATPRTWPRTWTGWCGAACGSTTRCRTAAGTVIRELYDLRFDPLEHKNLVPGGKPENESVSRVAEEMEGKLDAWIRDCKAARAASDREGQS